MSQFIVSMDWMDKIILAYLNSRIDAEEMVKHILKNNTLSFWYNGGEIMSFMDRNKKVMQWMLTTQQDTAREHCTKLNDNLRDCIVDLSILYLRNAVKQK